MRFRRKLMDLPLTQTRYLQILLGREGVREGRTKSW